MAINQVNSASNYVSQVQPQPQSATDRAAAEKEAQRVRDEAAKAAPAQPEPKQTVNSQGQTVGSVINVKA